MGHARDVAEATREAVVWTGGRFMTSPQMTDAGKPFGVPAGVLYFRGRIGAAGEVPARVATALLGIFPGFLIEQVWQGTAAIPVPAAVAAYVDACGRWSDDVLGEVPGLDRLAALGTRVLESANDTALPLFAAWRGYPRPEREARLGGYTLMLLRELRGGLHFAALRAHGVDVPLAVMADPGGGRPRLLRTGWGPTDVTALAARADAVPDLKQRWAAAERATDGAFGECLAVLSEAEQDEMALMAVRALEAAKRVASA
jgi:hypothetical protein